MNDNRVKLNPSQQEAVTYNEGPLLVIAGAGTGKTSTLVEKIAYLIKTKTARPEEIVCLTFTEKASSEMTERVDVAMPYGYFQMSINTFHGFADMILKRDITHIGLSPAYTLMTPAESMLFLRKNILKLDLHYFKPANNPTKFVGALLQHFSRLQDEDITPTDYSDWIQKRSSLSTESLEESEKLHELARAYSVYQQLKIQHEVCDFSDLIAYQLQLFRKRKHILEQYKSQFRFVLIDEFQDTNIAQYQLIKLLCPVESRPQLTVVGDDSQAIYKFRGASISNIMSFMHDYPDAKQVSLRDNYRSSQPILDHAHRLIQANNPDTLEARLGISKKLTGHRPRKTDPIRFDFFSHGAAEATYVVDRIRDLKKTEQYRFSDFCILVRANAHSDIFTAEMKSQGIPYQFHGPGTLFKQPEIKDLIAYLKLLTDLEDSTAMYRVCAMSILAIDQEDVSLILSFAKRIARSFFQSAEICCSFFYPAWMHEGYEQYRPHLPLIKQETRNKLIPLIHLIKTHLEKLNRTSAAMILYDFLEQTGFFKYLLAGTTGKEQDMIQHISQLLNKLRTLETQHQMSSVFDAVSYLDMSIDLGESPLTVDTDRTFRDAVHIMTIHGAKGLEFPVVFLPNLVQGRFPSTSRREAIPIHDELVKELLPQGDFHLQEERRLFYVGLTRTKDFAFMTASELYDDGVRKRKISPFIIETMGETYVQKKLSIKSEEKQQLSLFDLHHDLSYESVVVKNKSTIKNLSYSQLQTYEMCPLKYKYQYLLKIPTPPGAATSFGSTVHAVLQKFYEEYMVTRSLEKSRLLSLLQTEWIPVGYLLMAQEQEMKTKAESMLSSFYDTFHHPGIEVISLEKLFRVRIDKDLSVTGKIDRVDKHPDGTIEIVDYKTGKTPDEKELKKSLQLSIYAKAATDKGLFNTPVSRVTLTLYYLQDMKKFTSTRTEEALVEVETRIKEYAGNINQGHFEPKPGIHCNFCPFRLICEAW